jgi:uncharacterized protein
VKRHPHYRSSREATPYARAATTAAVLISLVILLQPRALAEKLEQLKPAGYVNDFAGVLDSQSTTQLAALCTEIDQKAHAQIAVVTIRTLEGVTVEDFANKLFERWGIGPKSDNRGVLILLAVDDHRYRVEVGYGLEPILPDGKVGGFGREIVPLLRQGNYNGALLQLTAQMARVIAADRGVTLGNLPRLESSPPRHQGANGFPVLALIVLAFFLFGGLGLVGPLFAIFSGRRYRRRGWYGGWWGGPWAGGGWSGGGFGGGSSGGGFGGFGGGSSGGGGASGSW